MQLILKRLTLFIFIALSISYSSAYSQGSAGEGASVESIRIIDMPNAGVLKKSSYCFYFRAFAQGGALAKVDVSPFENFQLGASYSMVGLIGDGDIYGQNYPQFEARFRFLDEKLAIPALAIGFSTQGYGPYIKSAKRFEIMSPGFYLTASKNYKWALGELAVHGGINYSIEPSESDRTINFFAGLEQSLSRTTAVNLEFNANLDDKNKSIRDNKGTLNASFRWSITSGATIELQARDILKSRTGSERISRALCFEMYKAL